MLNKYFNLFFKRLYENKILLFSTVSIYICIEYIVLGPFSFMQNIDVSDSFLTRYIALSSDLFLHGKTYWFQKGASGLDRLAQDLSYIHISEIIFLIFPPLISYQIIMFMKFFLSGYFTYLICIKHLKLSVISATFAGISFSLYHISIPSLQLAVELFPFILLSFDYLYEKGEKSKIYWFLIIPLAIFYSTCSNLSNTLPFGLILLLLWLILIKKRKSIIFFLLYCVFCFTTVAWQISAIWSLIVNGQISHKSNYIQPVITEPLIIYSIKDVISIFTHSMNQFNNILFISLILVAIIFSKFRDKQFLSTFYLVIFTTMGIVIVFYLQSLMFNIIGIFKSYQFNRFYYFTHFFYPICGVFAFKHIPNYINIATIKDIPARKFLIIISFFIIGYDSIIFKIHNLTRWAVGYNYAYQYNSNQLKELAKKEIIKNNYFRVGTISSPHGLLQPGHANAYGFETVDGYFNMQSQRYQEFWLKILADEEWHPRIKTWGNRLYLYRPGGTNNSKYVNYKPIVFKDYYRLNLLSLANTKYILSLKQKPIDPNLVCLYKPNIVHRITSQIERVLFKLKQTFTTGMTLYICENKTVLPRFFVTNKINIYNTSKTLLNELAFAKVDTLKNTVFIEKQFLKNINYHNIGFKTYKMEITKYTPDLINLTVELDGNGMLIVTNSYSPFWKVKVNGIETKILPAYHTFWGVYIKKGINEIIFNYDPPYRNL